MKKQTYVNCLIKAFRDEGCEFVSIHKCQRYFWELRFLDADGVHVHRTLLDMNAVEEPVTDYVKDTMVLVSKNMTRKGKFFGNTPIFYYTV